MPSLGAERIPTRRIAAFALRVGLIWAAFAAAWPLLAPVYRPLYCTMANLAFRNGEARAEFSVTRAPQGDHDVDILLQTTQADNQITPSSSPSLPADGAASRRGLLDAD